MFTFLSRTVGGKVNGHVKSLTYRSSPIPSGVYRNPSPANIFVWAKENFSRHDEHDRKHYL